MDILRNDDNYIVRYDIEEDGLKVYYNSNRIDTLPCSNHNIDVIERREEEQFDDYKENVLPEVRRLRIYEACLAGVLLVGAVTLSKNSPPIAVIFGANAVIQAVKVCAKSVVIKRLDLIDYCYQNRDIIMDKVENDELNQNGLSVWAKASLSLEETVTLNSSDCYSIRDLVKIKKQIKN